MVPVQSGTNPEQQRREATREQTAPAVHAGLRGKLALLAGAVFVSLALVETALVATRFTPARLNTGYLQFGYRQGIPSHDEDGALEQGRPVRMRLFRPHHELLWEAIPNTELTNSRGFRGKREYAVPKPPGVFRIVFLGDSCTFLGRTVYPEILEARLQARAAGRVVECVNAAVPGYTVYQGQRLLEKVLGLDPDVVVAYFGWNGHWRAQGNLTDREQHDLGHGPRTAALVRAWLAGRRTRPVHRVPRGEFERNLVEIRDTLLERGIAPVFVTAPSGFGHTAMPAWSYGFFSEYYGMSAAEVDGIPALHAAYAETVRQVARHEGTFLLDAKKSFATFFAGEPLFRDDRIHLRDEGHAALAEGLEALLVSQNLFQPSL